MFNAGMTERAPHREAGFTLIEILVVMGILAVVLGVMIGRGPARSRGLELRAAAGALVQSLRAARAQAIAGDQNVAVTIDPVRHVFAADGGPVHRVDASIGMAVPGTSLPGPGTSRKIRFSADGSSTGGVVVLGSGKRRLDVSVQWLTGQVSVADAH